MNQGLTGPGGVYWQHGRGAKPIEWSRGGERGVLAYDFHEVQQELIRTCIESDAVMRDQNRSVEEKWADLDRRIRELKLRVIERVGQGVRVPLELLENEDHIVRGEN